MFHVEQSTKGRLEFWSRTNWARSGFWGRGAAHWLNARSRVGLAELRRSVPRGTFRYSDFRAAEPRTKNWKPRTRNQEPRT